MTALHALSLDIRDVREDYERVVAEYRRALAHLDERLATATPAEAMQERQRIQEVAEGLRRAAQRLEASFRETSDLEAELREWEMRRGEDGERNADHPDVRAEILRSELVLRRDRSMLQAIAPEQSPFFAKNASDFLPIDPPEPPESEMERIASDEPLYPDAEHLIRTIRQTTKDVEGWHEQAVFSPEACDDIRRLRALHAALRRIDRAEGRERDRVVYAMRMR